ncbi:MAG: Gfo/Idh/MocA family oxidoreductase [Candidatus Omnitrophota bacterium]
MEKIKTAVIGIGHLGFQHARVCGEMPEIELIAVCDTDKEKADNAANQFKCRAFYDYKDIPARDIDCLSIVVPTPLHFTVGKYFLEKDKDLLIEKPITDKLKDARALMKLAQKNNLILQVGHIEQFNSAIQNIRTLIKEPKFIECQRLGPYPNRCTETGVVLDLMIHDLDIILHLVKSKVKTIDAVGVNVLSANEDIANVRLKFQNGCVCNITASRVSTKATRKIRFFQHNTYISLDYINQEAQLYTKKGDTIIPEIIRTPKEEPLKKEIQDFIECVRSRRKPIVSAKEATEALALAIKISKCIKHNGTI